MNIDLKQFQQAFFEEAAEHIESFVSTLLELEKQPRDTELLNTVFRCAHSIKGGAATFGLPEVAHFTHSLESLLDEVRNGHVLLDGDLSQLLLESIDHIGVLLSVAQGHGGDVSPAAALIQRLQAAGAGAPAATATAEVHVDEPAEGKIYDFRFNPPEDVIRRGCNVPHVLGQLGSVADVIELHCDAGRLPSLEEMDPETCYLCWAGQIRTSTPEDVHELFEFVAEEGDVTLTAVVNVESASKAVETAAGLPQPAVQSEPEAVARNQGKAEVASLRVPADKVDRLVNLVGELVINQSMLNEVTHDFSMDKLQRLHDTVESMERACRELQERVMAVRLVQLRQAFGRFPRLVRDLCAATGKKIELTSTGEDTELDKTLVEAILDPLTHLVRNSADHGIETPEERRAKGKPETGKLMLHAYHEGGNVVIEVADDGKGLDKDAILAKAYERGLLSPANPVPSDDQIYALIFQAGFSTAKALTDVSGRGVGMDIVRSTIQVLNGTVNLTTVPGEGTRIRIRLPLTMAILEGLSLKVGNEVYILPLTSIVESIRPRSADISLVAGSDEVVRVRGEILPMVRLHKVFSVQDCISDPTQALLVIIENEGRKVALLVDELIGQSQVVIKSMETNYRKVDAVAGATILGDGQVALILDVSQLVNLTSSVKCAA